VKYVTLSEEPLFEFHHKTLEPLGLPIAVSQSIARRVIEHAQTHRLLKKYFLAALFFWPTRRQNDF
jgi:hypothetical protein